MSEIQTDQKEIALTNLNRILRALNFTTYQKFEQINIENLKNLRSQASIKINNDFHQNNVMIAGYCNNIWVKAIYNGIFMNIAYKRIPYMVHKENEEARLELAATLSKYEILFRIGAFGLSFLMSKLSNIILRFMVRHGVKWIDKFLGKLIDEDSVNKQWIGAILMCIISLRFSPLAGLAGFLDSYSIYKGYKEHSSLFQQDLRDLNKSIEDISKLK